MGSKSGQGFRCGQERSIQIPKRESGESNKKRNIPIHVHGKSEQREPVIHPNTTCFSASAPDPGTTCKGGRREGVVPGVQAQTQKPGMALALVFSFSIQFLCQVPHSPSTGKKSHSTVAQLAHCYLSLPIPAEMSGF